MSAARPLVEARALSVEFPVGGLSLRCARRSVKAVHAVDLQIRAGETMALVGESGCGKSTLGRAVIRMTPVTSGRLVFDGQDITDLRGDALRRARSRFQMVFQDPFASLDPKARVFEALAEPLRVHRNMGRTEVADRVAETLEAVGLVPDHAKSYPHEFSGGQRQRIAIARAVILQPDFIVADEPLSALDVSMQLQILQLFDGLRRDYELTMLFISHDLARVFSFADRVAVMYLGEIVEIGRQRDIVHAPRHPYTRALLSAAPKLDPAAPDDAISLKGEIPSPLDPPHGCRFHTRCPLAEDICRTAAPPRAVFAPDHVAACHVTARDADARTPEEATP